MRYFVISDVHGFYDEMRAALRKAGYDPKNKDHFLILCGDCLDRGPKPLEVIRFLKSIPKSRRVLIRGNHEYLFKELLKKEWPDDYDKSPNKTFDTFCRIAGIDDQRFYGDNSVDGLPIDRGARWRAVKRKVAESKLSDWFFGKDWVDYFEIEGFVFVHSFIPVTATPIPLGDDIPEWCKPYYQKYSYSYNPKWREADGQEWYEAVWGCPWRQAQMGLNQTGKRIVCGHWHASDFHEHLAGFPAGLLPDDPRSPCDIYFGKDIVAIDACTAATGYCNVLVIREDGVCHDQNGLRLPFDGTTVLDND